MVDETVYLCVKGEICDASVIYIGQLCGRNVFTSWYRHRERNRPFSMEYGIANLLVGCCDGQLYNSNVVTIKACAYTSSECESEPDMLWS